jgi:hypothetical protein
MGVGHRPRFAGLDVLLGRRAPDVSTRSNSRAARASTHSTSSSGASNPIFTRFMRNPFSRLRAALQFDLSSMTHAKKRHLVFCCRSDALTMEYQQATYYCTRIASDLSILRGGSIRRTRAKSCQPSSSRICQSSSYSQNTSRDCPCASSSAQPTARRATDQLSLVGRLLRQPPSGPDLDQSKGTSLLDGACHLRTPVALKHLRFTLSEHAIRRDSVEENGTFLKKRALVA